MVRGPRSGTSPSDRALLDRERPSSLSVVRLPADVRIRRSHRGPVRTQDRRRPRTPRRVTHLARGVGRLRPHCRGRHGSGRHRSGQDPATGGAPLPGKPSTEPRGPRAPRTAALPAPSSSPCGRSAPAAALLRAPARRQQPHRATDVRVRLVDVPAVADQHRRDHAADRRSLHPPTRKTAQGRCPHRSMLSVTPSASTTSTERTRVRLVSRPPHGSENGTRRVTVLVSSLNHVDLDPAAASASGPVRRVWICDGPRGPSPRGRRLRC